MRLADIRAGMVRFLLSMRAADGAFEFRFSPSSKPNLIGTSLAAMLAGLTGRLDTLTENERRCWADRICACQRDDGWFEDDDISEDNLRPGYGKDRALLHRTRHALMALHALRAKPVKPLAMVAQWLGGDRMKAWYGTLNLADYWYSSNMMMDAAVLLHESFARWNTRGAIEAVESLLDCCDAHIDPKTGYHDGGRSEIRNAMAGVMHLYPVYVIRNRKILRADAAIQTTLALQQPDGLFGYESGTGGEDCLDYDAASILSNLGFQNHQYHDQIRTCFEKMKSGLEICRNADGGFCAHRRPETYYFGTRTTSVQAGESSLWATYSRGLTLLMIEGFIMNKHPDGWQTGHNMMEVWDGGVGFISRHPPGWKQR